MDDLFRTDSQKILFYQAIETQIDPIYKEDTLTYLNPLPVSAIVIDLGFSQIQWKMPGVCYKIKIGTEDFIGWKKNGQIQYRIEDNYLRAYVQLMQISD
jgi:hypothetical protein